MAWEPTEKMIEWAKKLIDSISDNGVWTIPDNLSSYRFFKEKKEIHFIRGEIDEYFHKNKATFAKIGYTLLDRRGVTGHPVKGKEIKCVSIPSSTTDEELRNMLPGMVSSVQESESGFCLTIDGYDRDNRELYEIPEVLDLFSRIFSTGFASVLEVSTTIFGEKKPGLGSLEVWAAINGLINTNVTSELFKRFLTDLQVANKACGDLTGKNLLLSQETLEGKPQGMEVKEGMHKAKKFK